MGTRRDNDRRYLEFHRGKWRVSMAVPKARQKALGVTRLKQSLNTDSLSEANRLKWPIVDMFRHIIAGTVPVKTLEARAEEFRLARLAALDPSSVDEAIEREAEAILGREIDEHRYPGQDASPIYDPQREALAGQFVRLAKGEATRIDRERHVYEAQLKVKPRTKADDVRALAMLLDWCKAEGVAPTLEAFSDRALAVKFFDKLCEEEQAGGRTAVTLNKYLRRLSIYWRWLGKRNTSVQNVWRGLTIALPHSTSETKPRPFTDDEMERLLTGPASPEMHDLMRIAALSGARLDAIVCLSVEDCTRDDGCFKFKPQKKEPGPRLCPIHPALAELIKRRTAGKSPSDPLFPEYPPPANAEESLRERSFKASNEFTTYRRSVGVEEKAPGARRSRTVFHSFRHWFVTQAERAGQPDNLIAYAVGHKRNGVTLGIYSSGPLVEQTRVTVEAVKVPKGFDLVPAGVPAPARKRSQQKALDVKQRRGRKVRGGGGSTSPKQIA